MRVEDRGPERDCAVGTWLLLPNPAASSQQDVRTLTVRQGEPGTGKEWECKAVCLLRNRVLGAQ